MTATHRTPDAPTRPAEGPGDNGPHSPTGDASASVLGPVAARSADAITTHTTTHTGTTAEGEPTMTDTTTDTTATLGTVPPTTAPWSRTLAMVTRDMGIGRSLRRKVSGQDPIVGDRLEALSGHRFRGIAPLCDPQDRRVIDAITSRTDRYRNGGPDTMPSDIGYILRQGDAIYAAVTVFGEVVLDDVELLDAPQSTIDAVWQGLCRLSRKWTVAAGRPDPELIQYAIDWPPA